MVDVLVVVLLQMQHILLDLHIVFGRKHVDRVLAHMHAVLGLEHRHGGIFPEDIREQASVIGREVLNDYKSHTGVRRQKCQELLQRLQSARR